MRNIVVDGVKWRYDIGRQNLVAQQPESKRKHVIGLARLLGYDNSSYEKDSWKSPSSRYLRITPRLVADFIRNADWYKTAPLNQIAQENERIRKETEKPKNDYPNYEDCDNYRWPSADYFDEYCTIKRPN